MKLNEFAKAVFLPAHYLVNPNKAGSEDPKTSIASGIIQLLFSTAIILYIIIAGGIYERSNNDLNTALMMGLTAFPIVMLLIGTLLHFSFPAKNPKHRLLAMLSVPWNIMSSTILLFLSMITIQVVYLGSTTSDTSNSMDHFSDSVSTITHAVLGIFLFFLFTCCLSNIRKTSKLRNIGDSAIVTLLFSVPFLIL